MQPKADPSLAIGVTEIVKTFISHPDHGIKASEIPGLVKDIWKAFQIASQGSDEVIAADASAAVVPAKVDEPAATVQEDPTAEAAVEQAVVAEQPDPESVQPPAANAISKARNETQAVSAPAATAPVEAPTDKTPNPTVADATEAPVTETTARKSGSRKKTSVKAGTAFAEPIPTESVTEDEAPSEQAPVDPEVALEEKFGGKVTRSPWAGMNPEEAIQRDKIICLIDGLTRKMLSRHLLAKYNMTPEEYRAWFHLRDDYPMTAPGYSKEKSDYAKVVGLGTTKFAKKTKTSAAEASEAVVTEAAAAPEATAAETTVTDTAAATATPKTSRRTRKLSKQAEKTQQRTTA